MDSVSFDVINTIPYTVLVHAKALPFTSSISFNSKVVCMQAQSIFSKVTDNTCVFLLSRLYQSVIYVIQHKSEAVKISTD